MKHKKFSRGFKILITVIAVAIVGAGTYTLIQKKPWEKSYPKVMRVIYFNNTYISDNTAVQPFYESLTPKLIEYMQETGIQPESYVLDGSAELLEKGTYNQRKNRLYIYIRHTNPQELKLIEEKIKSYKEVEEVREKERPTGYTPSPMEPF